MGLKTIYAVISVLFYLGVTISPAFGRPKCGLGCHTIGDSAQADTPSERMDKNWPSKERPGTYEDSRKPCLGCHTLSGDSPIIGRQKCRGLGCHTVGDSAQDDAPLERKAENWPSQERPETYEDSSKPCVGCYTIGDTPIVPEDGSGTLYMFKKGKKANRLFIRK